MRTRHFVRCVGPILSVSEQGGIIPGGLSWKRKHTHCSQHPLSDARMKAGMRRDATEVEIFVRLSALLGDGQVCYLSPTGLR